MIREEGLVGALQLCGEVASEWLGSIIDKGLGLVFEVGDTTACCKGREVAWIKEFEFLEDIISIAGSVEIARKKGL